MIDPPFALLQVCAYCSIIAAMAYSALVSGSRVAAAGSLLFVLSDLTLAWNKFAPPIAAAWWHPQLIVMSTYYVAQLLIAGSTSDGMVPPSSRTHTAPRP